MKKIFFLIFLMGCNSSNNTSLVESNLENRSPETLSTHLPKKNNNLVNEDKNLYFLGLANLGNTCFANAVHKLLWSDKTIATSMEKVMNKSKIQESFFNFISNLNLKWNNFLNKIKNKKNNFFTKKLNALYDLFEEELFKKSGSRHVDPLSEHPSRIREDQIDPYIYFQKLCDFLEFPRVIGGFFLFEKSSFTDGATRFIFEKTNDTDDESSVPPRLTPRFSLEVGISDDAILTMNDALYYELDHVSSDLRHPPHDPNQHARAMAQIKKVLIVENEAPQRIFILLNRVVQEMKNGTYRVRKITKEIKFLDPIHLDFYSLENKESLVAGKVPYEFRAVAVQRGGLRGGHYVAYHYDDQQKKWFLHDDRNVTSISEKRAVEEIEKNGYLFIYTRLN